MQEAVQLPRFKQPVNTYGVWNELLGEVEQETELRVVALAAEHLQDRLARTIIHPLAISIIVIGVRKETRRLRRSPKKKIASLNRVQFQI